jgi:hypothetical protein
MKHREITELLAYRDGDDGSLTPRRRAELAADPDVPAKLARLSALTHALRNLPEQPPSPTVWVAVEARLSGRENAHRVPLYRRYGPALAAGVCAIALAAWLWTVRVDHADEASVAELVDASQLLERSWLARRNHHEPDASIVHGALLYRIASIDSQLNQITADGSATPGDVRALWRKRVALLQSLLDVDQVERVQYTTL